MKCCEPRGFPHELAPIEAKAVSDLNQLVEPLLSEHLGLIPLASEHVVGLIPFVSEHT